MLIVALTGGIAAGKSVVARFLEERGCAVHSADQAAHEVMAPGSGAWGRLRTHFGPGILNPDRTIDRRRLGAIVFADEAERRFLNSVVHPLVLEKKKEIIARLEKEGKTKIFISEAALTIEAGYAGLFDRVIVVYCRPEVQAARLMARDGLDRQAALQKIRAQMPQEEKKNQADYLINTSDTLADTEIRTEMVFRQLLRDYQEKEEKKAAGRS
jgi:dephospho-CoA kinase